MRLKAFPRGYSRGLECRFPTAPIHQLRDTRVAGATFSIVQTLAPGSTSAATSLTSPHAAGQPQASQDTAKQCQRTLPAAISDTGHILTAASLSAKTPSRTGPRFCTALVRSQYLFPCPSCACLMNLGPIQHHYTLSTNTHCPQQRASLISSRTPSRSGSHHCSADRPPTSSPPSLQIPRYLPPPTHASFKE